MTHSAVLKEKDCRSRILYPVKIPFSNGKVIKTLSNKEKHGDVSPKDHPKRAGILEKSVPFSTVKAMSIQEQSLGTRKVKSNSYVNKKIVLKKAAQYPGRHRRRPARRCHSGLGPRGAERVGPDAGWPRGDVRAGDPPRPSAAGCLQKSREQRWRRRAGAGGRVGAPTPRVGNPRRWRRTPLPARVKYPSPSQPPRERQPGVRGREKRTGRVISRTGPTSPAAETRQGSTYFRRDEVWGSPGGHEPPAGVRALLLFSWGRSSPRPGARAPLGRRCLCAERCWLQTQPGTGWPSTPQPGPQPPARRALPPRPPPPGPSQLGRRDPRPRPLPTQSFGGGGKCPGSGPAGGGSGRAGFPPSSSSPPYRLPPPPPPLLLPRSPWGCSPAARKDKILLCYPRVVLNSWPQAILLPWPPKVLELQKDAAFKVLSWKQRLGPHQMLNLLSTLIFHFTFIRTTVCCDCTCHLMQK
ncbi:uncharacterized protein [Macaca fascicularis]|uniref:uncharacterized protein n=1 Tax=Macaca fascicularis TaxID=9541 RepID=UPI003D15F18E